MGKKDNAIYVRSKEQFENPEHFDQVKADEFPHRSSLLDINRRDLLKFVGGSLALAGLASGCRFLPQQKIVPFVQAPEDRLPGQDTHFATAVGLGGYATGVLVRSYEGRPVKIEGNPNHPSSLGSTDARTQAELAVVYDPDRLQDPTLFGQPATWDEFLKAARSTMSRAHDGAGTAILTPNVGSPTEQAQLAAFMRMYPGARWFQYEPVNRDNVFEGAVMAFGREVEIVYDYSKADVIVTLEADPFLDGPGNVRYQRDIATKRAVGEGAMAMNRIYAIEGMPTLAGAMADHRWRVRSSAVLSVANALAAKLGVTGAAGAASPIDDKRLTALANDLTANRGRSVVVAGPHQPSAVHALVHAINATLGNLGQTVKTTAPAHVNPGRNMSDLKALVTALDAGQVTFLMIVGGNPVYDAPSDLRFGEVMAKAPLSAHLSLYPNETTEHCQWGLPASHFLEAWGDARGHDGTACVVQPLIQPLYDSRSLIEVLEHLQGKGRTAMDVVMTTWQPMLAAAPGGADDAWAKALSNGVIPGSESPALNLTPTPNLPAGLTSKASGEIDLLILPDPTIYDGRYSNIGWLQELPKPLTNLMWDNAFHMSRETAKKLSVGQKTQVLGQPYYGNWDIVKVTANGKTVEGPVYIHDGMADDLLVVHMGYGRKVAGMVGNVGDPIRQGGGFDAMPLRSSTDPIFATNVSISPTGRDYKLANSQFYNLLDTNDYDSKRDIIRETTLAAYMKNHEVLAHPTTKTMEPEGEEREEVSIFQGPKGFNGPDQYQWAMTIDLNTCTGCGACVAACQAENNIPTVGKHETLRHRAMHWIRIDRYYRVEEGKAFDYGDPLITFQPVTCVQCEKAPCEPVCPVAATTHSHEGINQMVYNRCVGTRYCSNNCPYKVRRFNYLHYTRKPEDVPVLKLLQNPDVTVRGRGVMEKCTYCVHRINHARIKSKREAREIQDGEIVTACQQACPSKSIVFGDMRRPENAVSRSRASNRNYVLLESLNTRPRTTYLGKVRNPNPELEA
ncbi:MAG: 4Fe-4S dicluster domain-containing protein [Armatimonadetes bacterium]|nr:4Fe-4S dicluster domain-containing protein [Armatimonadota bacterium]